MKEGKMFKEYYEFVQTRFTTKKGLADFFTVTAIWYMIIVETLDPWFDAIFGFWSGYLGANIFAKYLSYLTLGIVFTAVSVALRWVLEKVWSFLFDGKVPKRREFLP